jgi:Pyruvate/2-oxoacid:ferredoxin oxidoreductase delta subunit
MSDAAYIRIAEKLAQSGQGAPTKDGRPSPAFVEFLKLIYTPEEAEVVQFLENFPAFMTNEQVAEAAGRELSEIESILKAAHDKYALMGELGLQSLLTIFYTLNFHNRYPDVRPGDLEAAKLYLEFFIEEKFYKNYETPAPGHPVFRVLPVGRTIEETQEVIGYEEGLNRIDSLAAETIAMVPCPCRTRTEKLGIRECQDKHPIGYCLIPGANGEKFIRLGYGKKATKEEAKAYLSDMVDSGVVVNSDNYREGDPLVICTCCGCCCSMTRGRTRWDNPDSMLPSNYIPRADDSCVACGVCVERCVYGALSIDEEIERSVADVDLCIGCGVCVAGCPTGALKLFRFDRTQTYENLIKFAMAMMQKKAALAEEK